MKLVWHIPLENSSYEWIPFKLISNASVGGENPQFLICEKVYFKV